MTCALSDCGGQYSPSVESMLRNYYSLQEPACSTLSVYSPITVGHAEAQLTKILERNFVSSIADSYGFGHGHPSNLLVVLLQNMSKTPDL